MLRHRIESLRIRHGVGGLALLALAAAGCRQDAPTDRVRVSGHVEADDVQLAAEVGGRVLELTIAEGDRVTAGQVLAELDLREIDAAVAKATAAAEKARRDAARVAAFEKGLLSKASAEDLPRVSALGLDKMQEREDENVRRSTAYARESLKL